ncbi:MAG: cation diffusion facilitator family transporter [bacterium]|nr:cation diffusion facilitator family transporter [bacterium]
MKKINYVMFRSMIINTLLVIVKVLVGVIGHSSVLIADGIHSLSDLSTDVIAIFGNVFANKPADENHPFGHGKIEYLTSIVVGIIIFCLGLKLVLSAFTQKFIIPNNIVFITAIFTIIMKNLLANYILKKGREYKNSILIASGKESKTDVYSSFVVLVAFIGSKLTDINYIFSYSDAIGTAIVGSFIIFTSFNVLKENVTSILGQREYNEELVNKIKNIIKVDNKVKSIDDITIIKYGSYYSLNLDISFDSSLNLKEANDISERAKKELLKKIKELSYIKISIKPYME